MTPAIRSKHEHLRQLIKSKSEWSRSLTPDERALGFLGWHERGYVPHCDFPNLTQLVTFRLNDSMPVTRRAGWEHLLKIPLKAGLCQAPEEWPASSARFRDHYRRLVIASGFNA